MPNSSAAVQFITVDANYGGQRIDNFLLSRLKGVPKSWLYRLMRKGQIRVNKKRITPIYRVQAGDIIRVAPLRMAETVKLPTPRPELCEFLQQRILVENDDWLALNKPAGLAVHTGSGVTLGVIEILRASYPAGTFLELVHRLDKDTSGCLLIAKTRMALQALQDLLRSHQINKTYQTLVLGRWPVEIQRVEASLLRIQQADGNSQVVVSPEGKRALTKFCILQKFSQATLMAIKLETGRMHQIRVHAQYVGYPVAGDDKYGDKIFNKQLRQYGLRRLFLHAAELEFEWKGNKQQTVTPLPEELKQILQKMEIS